MKKDTPNDKEVEFKKEPVIASEQQKSMTVLMKKVMGDGSFAPTESQIDEILSQKSKIIDYVHEDKKLDSKDSRFYFISILSASVLIVLCVLFFAKEYLTQTLWDF